MSERLKSLSFTLIKFFNLKSSSIEKNLLLNINSLYSLLLLITSHFQEHFNNKEIFYDFLLLLFIETRNISFSNSSSSSSTSSSSHSTSYSSSSSSPTQKNYQNITNWLESRGNLIITSKDVKLLLQYLALFRPLRSENILEYEAFERIKEQNPLLVQTSQIQWCEETIQFIQRRIKEIKEDEEINPTFQTKPSGIKNLFRGFSFNNQVTKISPLEEAEDSIVVRKSTSPLKMKNSSPCVNSCAEGLKKIDEINSNNNTITDLTSLAIIENTDTLTTQNNTLLSPPYHTKHSLISKYSSSLPSSFDHPPSSSSSSSSSSSPLQFKQFSLESILPEDV